MELNNRVYRPDLETVAQNRIYYEIWRGLPQLSFDEVETECGQAGLRDRQDGNYLWISPETIEALSNNPDAALIAILRHMPGKVNAFWVSPAMKTICERRAVQDEDSPKRFERVPMTLTEAIGHAKKLNERS